MAPPDAPEAAPADGPPPMLSWWSFGVCLAIVLGIFLGLHPIWEPLDMAQMDANILWSYAPIPLLVLVFLALERKLRASSWLLETLRLTLVKFGLTFAVTHALWTVMPPPGHAETGSKPAVVRTREDPYALREPPVVTVLEEGTTGRVAGVVVDGQGRAVAGALVQLVGGWGRVTFAPPAAPVVLVADADGFAPGLAVVQAYQTLTLHTSDGMLHTARAVDPQGRLLFNYPAIPSGGRSLLFDRHLGLVTLACTVHADEEREVRLLVVDHPFAALSDERGGFAFEGVPAGVHELVAGIPGGSEAREGLTVRAEQGVDVSIALP